MIAPPFLLKMSHITFLVKGRITIFPLVCWFFAGCIYFYFNEKVYVFTFLHIHKVSCASELGSGLLFAAGSRLAILSYVVYRARSGLRVCLTSASGSPWSCCCCVAAHYRLKRLSAGLTCLQELTDLSYRSFEIRYIQPDLSASIMYLYHKNGESSYAECTLFPGKIKCANWRRETVSKCF